MAERLNRYCCQRCNKNIITVDRGEGVTPFMLPCMRTKSCPGPMTSRFYKVEPVWGPPTYEWRKPTKKEYKKMSRAMKEHVDMGGLDIYPITGAKPDNADEETPEQIRQILRDAVDKYRADQRMK